VRQHRTSNVLSPAPRGQAGCLDLLCRHSSATSQSRCSHAMVYNYPRYKLPAPLERRKIGSESPARENDALPQGSGPPHYWLLCILERPLGLSYYWGAGPDRVEFGTSIECPNLVTSLHKSAELLIFGGVCVRCVPDKIVISSHIHSGSEPSKMGRENIKLRVDDQPDSSKGGKVGRGA